MKVRFAVAALIWSCFAAAGWAQSRTHLAPYVGGSVSLSSDFGQNPDLRSSPRLGGLVGALFQQTICARWSWVVAGQFGNQRQALVYQHNNTQSEYQLQRWVGYVQPSIEYRFGNVGVYAGWYASCLLSAQSRAGSGMYQPLASSFGSNRFNTGGALGLRYYGGAWMLFAQANHDARRSNSDLWVAGWDVAHSAIYRPYQRGIDLGIAYRFGL